MEHLLKGFRADLEGQDRNEILVKKEDRNGIVCQAIIDQVAETKRFEIPTKPFGEDTCPKCSGLGQKILFERELSVRVCLKCTDGKRLIPCTKCTNGRYIRDRGDLRINVECKFCHGTKQRNVTCRTCRGTTELRKMVITPKIKSTTPCKLCRELGFIDENLFALIDDTAKFVDDAEKLAEALFSSEEAELPNTETTDSQV